MRFDAMGALSSKYNDRPQEASRAFDRDRDGFVIAGGGGTLVLEELEHAKARGAKIYGELVGYGATSDGADMVAPSGEGAVRCMQQALATLGNREVDYINTHGTSTPVNSTKSMTGHSQGAAGVTEAIYSLIMMEQGFIAPSINIDALDPSAEGMPIISGQAEQRVLNRVMSNSFGFGGTNCTLVFQRLQD